MKVVLRVEDSENDRVLIRRAFAKASGEFSCCEADSVRKAILYLTRNDEPFGDVSASPFPDLILCDLEMPKYGGFWLLDWLRTQSQLRDIKVAVMTGLCPPDIGSAALNKGACACIDKNQAIHKPDLFLCEIRNCFAPSQISTKQPV